MSVCVRFLEKEDENEDDEDDEDDEDEEQEESRIRGAGRSEPPKLIRSLGPKPLAKAT